jgi:predicted nucleotidyltransferase
MQKYPHPDLKDIDFPDTPFPLAGHLILLGRRGSEAHGTYIPPTDPDAIDDRDLFGVVIPPVEYFVGLEQWDHSEDIIGPWDTVLDDIRKWAKLLCAQNPNVLQGLYLEPEDYLYTTEAGRFLIQERAAFQSRDHAVKSFLGYADGQAKRMTAIGAYRGYMGAKRKELVDRHGYDIKNAAHYLRILMLGCEYLGTGKMHVRLTPEALAIVMPTKRGEYTLGQVNALGAELKKKLYELASTSPLPQAIDRKRVNEILLHATHLHAVVR